MRKAVTPVVAIILLIVMTVGSAIIGFIWIEQVTVNAQERTGASVESSSGGEATRLNIVSVKGDGIVVENVGSQTIDNVTLFLNDELTEYDLTEPLSPGSATIILYNPANESEDLEVTIIPISSSGGSTSVGLPVSETSLADQNTPEAGYLDWEAYLACVGAGDTWFFGVVESDDKCCDEAGEYFTNATLSRSYHFCQ